MSHSLGFRSMHFMFLAELGSRWVDGVSGSHTVKHRVSRWAGSNQPALGGLRPDARVQAGGSADAPGERGSRPGAKEQSKKGSPACSPQYSASDHRMRELLYLRSSLWPRAPLASNSSYKGAELLIRLLRIKIYSASLDWWAGCYALKDTWTYSATHFDSLGIFALGKILALVQVRGDLCCGHKKASGSLCSRSWCLWWWLV